MLNNHLILEDSQVESRFRFNHTYRYTWYSQKKKEN